MSLYYTLSQVPELVGLTRRQRTLVYRCALEALFSEQPSSLWEGSPWILGGILGGVLAGWGVVAGIGLSHSKWLVLSTFVLGGAMAGTFIGAQLLTGRVRPYLRRVLEERKEEIAQIK
jgi:hypothetical protein